MFLNFLFKYFSKDRQSLLLKQQQAQMEIMLKQIQAQMETEMRMKSDLVVEIHFNFNSLKRLFSEKKSFCIVEKSFENSQRYSNRNAK